MRGTGAGMNYKPKSTSLGSTSAMRLKSRSSCRRGIWCSMATWAMRQSLGLRGVMPAQRQRAYRAPASAYVSVDGTSMDRAMKCERNTSNCSMERAPCSNSCRMTGARQAALRCNIWRNSRLAAVLRPRRRSSQTEVSTRFTAHSRTHGPHIIVRVKKVFADEVKNIQLSALFDQVSQGEVHHLTFGASPGQAHGLGHKFVIKHNIGSHEAPPDEYSSTNFK